MKASVFLNLVYLLIPAVSVAALLPTKTILQKTVDNAGSGAYSIEQDVQFTNGDETLSVKEVWLIENEKNMRLSVSGGKDLNNSFKLQFVYSGGQKFSLSNGSKKNEKIPEDFLERFFNFRSPEAFFNQLIMSSIIPAGSPLNRTPIKSNGNFTYEPEPWTRFSRTGGAVTYAFGSATPPEQEANNPGIWIEQDLFVIRKVRLKSQVEMSANNYNQFAKGLYYPRQRTIRWGNNTVTIRLISVSPRANVPANLFQATSLDISPKVDGITSLPAKDAITEFYTRFR